MANRTIILTVCGVCLVVVDEQHDKAVFAVLDVPGHPMLQFRVDGVNKADYLTSDTQIHVTRANGTNSVTKFHDGSFRLPSSPLPPPPANREKMDFDYLLDFKRDLYPGEHPTFDLSSVNKLLTLNDGVVAAGFLHDAQNPGDGIADPVIFSESPPMGTQPAPRYAAGQVLVEIILGPGDTAVLSAVGKPDIPLAASHRIELRNRCFFERPPGLPPGSHPPSDFPEYYNVVNLPSGIPQRLPQVPPGGMQGSMCIPGGGGDHFPP